jgi:hypothetical protein
VDINPAHRVQWYVPYASGVNADIQIHKLVRQMAEIPELLRSIVGNPTYTDSDQELEDENNSEAEEGTEVVNLSRTALVSLKKLPPLEELEQMTDMKKGTDDVEEEVPSSVRNH